MVTVMNFRMPLLLSSLACLALSITLAGNAQNKPAKTPAPTYAQVQAIFTKNCIGCHGEMRAREGIRLDSYKSVMAGGEEGAIIVPGKPAKSKLMMAINGTKGVKQMPFRRDPLTKAEIGLIEAWIAAGAKNK